MAPLALVCMLFLVASSSAMPNGPPQDACVTLRPMHPGTTEQTSPSPVLISASSPSYTPSGDPVRVTIVVQGILSFRGVMIQARPASNPDGLPLGSFTIPTTSNTKMTTQNCGGIDNTANHMNPSDVSIVIVDWNPPAVDVAVDIKFYYTIVQNLSTYWVMQSSATVQCAGCGREDSNALIKAHGSVMTVAWGVLVPIGILLALFYKVVWPDGEWFYAHIVVMSTALGFVLLGIVLIVVHAEGRWLTTTPVNTPHQVLGIIATVAIAVNPFLAIIRCEPQSPWRPVYNWVHGITGLFAAQCTAFAAMLLGLNIFREVASSPNEVHYAVYTTSATVGLVLMLIALYNIYNISYHKAFPRASDFSSPSQIFGGPKLEEQTDDDFEASRDSPLRAAFGIVIIVVLLLLAIASIVLIALG